MFRSIRRLLIAACACALSAPGSASAQFTAINLTSTKTATLAPCPAITPTFLAAPRVTVPSAGSGASCTNDTQCTTLGESCVFASSSVTSGTCSASGLLTREDIHYVAGNLVDVELAIPTCTDVTHVNGVPLGGWTGPDAQAAPASWTFLPSAAATTINGQTALHPRIRVTIPNLGDGTPVGFSIQLTARTGGAIATQDVQIASVAAVDAAVRNTAAERRIRNAFVTSVYERYGDYEQFYTEQGTRVYDVDWRELVSLTNGNFDGTDIRIQNGRIVFSVQSKADVPGCDTTVRINGILRFVPARDGVQLVWDRDPYALVDAGGICAALTLGLYELVVDAIASRYDIAGTFAKTISENLGADENGFIPVCPGCRVVDVKIGNGKLEIWTLPPVHRVRVQVRSVRGMDVTANPASHGLMIPAGYVAPIAGGGTIEACVAPDGIPGRCDSLVVDTDGAFNWWGSDVPVPDSIAYTQTGQGVVLGGRANARDRLKGVLRDTSRLPSATLPADALIVRRSPATASATTRRALATPGCTLPTSSTPYRIAIGVNESPTAPPVRGSFEATVLLADTAAQSATLFQEAPSCRPELVLNPIRSTPTATATLTR